MSQNNGNANHGKGNYHGKGKSDRKNGQKNNNYVQQAPKVVRPPSSIPDLPILK